jgi:sulfur dioxygenase
MAIEILEVNGTNCRSYLLVSGREAMLVDPVRERVPSYLAILEERDLELRMVLETHLHADHLMLNRVAKEALGVPVVMHRASPSPLVDRHVVDGEILTLGGDRIEVIHTPGHTPDSVCFRTASAVLTGDVLLIGGSGRTDFPGGDAGAQYEAVTTRLFALPDETVVWPAHDYAAQTSSTIGQEKRSNARFLGQSRATYIAKMAALGLPFPDRIQEVLQVNQSGFEAAEVSFPKVGDMAMLRQVSPHELHARLRDAGSPPVVLDVREPEEFTGELGHVEGALLVPLDALASRLPKLLGYTEREVVVVCRAGARSGSAAAILQRAGFARVANLEGGMLAWAFEGLPVQR